MQSASSISSLQEERPGGARDPRALQGAVDLHAPPSPLLVQVCGAGRAQACTETWAGEEGERGDRSLQHVSSARASRL